jgi:hypothetical protein
MTKARFATYKRTKARFATYKKTKARFATYKKTKARFATYNKTKARVSRSSSPGGKKEGTSRGQERGRGGRGEGGRGEGEPLDIVSVLAQTHAYKDVMMC